MFTNIYFRSCLHNICLFSSFSFEIKVKKIVALTEFITAITHNFVWFFAYKKYKQLLFKKDDFINLFKFDYVKLYTGKFVGDQSCAVS